ncbi:2-oxoglutarate ferredoxin oxidoreductase subunit alpha [Alteribacillus persepolensis]|uniref:2-oxoglutarate ferredoxin oxidoreductase subunit alpha n=1 Tax=Alteribacillus persepolensis TaxID=568899 RepID=A0A1G7YUW1_9BACI|nr:2-oxoacid:acceptor oxidoreductase subunit alpha [Alteribacillus persepolensis]SDH00298.1 2-oxoglutarate ferredoxin oxidoreductase subunit alpha [Alteribacillus persepolensis]
MIDQLSWKVGGQQGEGIESTGEIFSTALNRLGYYLYGYRHFSSRIKGGHTNNKIRVSTKPINAVSDDLDILVAFDQETIDVNYHELRSGGVVIADAKFNPSIPEDGKATLYEVPFTETAKELGTPLMKNMVAVGASSAILGIPADYYQEVVEEIFSKKGQSVVDKNMQALQTGAEQFREQAGDNVDAFLLEEADGKKRMFMIGNDAIGLGAVTAGSRFMAAYPITPASEIMEYLIKTFPDFGGTVIQTEDEIAAANMAIGSNYAGVRALTASAGPGLSLMTEAIGLSGMTETPLVIVDTQRGGPSTGLPTKQEQSDMMAMLYGTHGEIPKIVIAPSTVQEAFYDTITAFNMAEEYQCPVILMSDLALSLGKQTVEPLNFDNVQIRRGKLDQAPDLPVQAPEEYFNRYEYEAEGDGISTRLLPGTENGIYHVTGVEHDETGKPSEKPENRQQQMDKRLKKTQTVPYRFDEPVYRDEPYEKADLLVVGINSTRGTIQEAVSRLREEGHAIHHAHIRLLHPFPVEELEQALERTEKVVVVENNATAQLANIIRLNTGVNAENILKYDGNPFLPGEIYRECKELL